MEHRPLARPFVYLATGILILALGVGLHLLQVPLESRRSILNLATLGLVVFAALLVGIISYWVASGSQMVPASPDPQDLRPPDRLDFSDMVLQPQMVVQWYESNLTRYRERCTTLERISQLLGFMNYTLDLAKQLRVALHFSQELFPECGLMIFLPEGAKIRFESGCRPDPTTGLVILRDEDDLVKDAQEIIRDRIDLEKLASLAWKTFSLPLRHGREPSLTTILPLQSWNRILGLIAFQPLRGRTLSPDELVIAGLINRQIALFLENHFLHLESLNQERLTHEVEIARAVQVSSLPGSTPSFPGYDMYGVCNPSREFSGDYYDLIPRSNGTLAVIVADVSGKGLPAALFLAKIQALVRAGIDQVDRPGDLLVRLSRQIAKENAGTLFATMLVAILTPNSPRVTFASAGHCKPLVVRTGNGFVEEFPTQVGIPLGLFDTGEDEYQDMNIDLIPGDGVLLYSDGLTDITNRSRERYGLERVRLCLEKATVKRASEMVFHLMTDLNRFKGPIPLEDDTTIVYFRWEPNK